MSAPLTPAELAEIRERAEKATPGPWKFDETQDDGAPPIVFGQEDRSPLLCKLYDIFAEGRAGRDEDAAFIAAARTDIPRLLAALEGLQARVAALEALLAGEVIAAPTPEEVAERDALRARVAELEALAESYRRENEAMKAIDHSYGCEDCAAPMCQAALVVCGCGKRLCGRCRGAHARRGEPS